MGAKDILFANNGAHGKMCDGVKKLADVVGSTLGPGGRNVIYENYGWPLPTKDGVSVARQIELNDKWENVGVQMVKQVAAKTCDDAGDGTTTATILANAIFSEGIRYAGMGMNPIDMQKGIDKFVQGAVEYIRENYVVDIKDDEQKVLEIATVSANWDDEIGGIVASAINKVGIDGSIHIEDAKSYETSIKFIDGIQFDRGYSSPYFINDETKQIVDMENPYVLLYKGTLKKWDEVKHLLVQTQKTGKALFIVADDFDADITSTLVANKTRNKLQVSTIKAPWFKDMRLNTMEDLAVYMDTVYYDPFTNPTPLDCLSIEELGRCGRITSTALKTTFMDGVGTKEAIQARIDELKEQKASDDTLSEIDRGNIDLRIQQLCASVAFISIGAKSEVEYSEKYDRYDDAIKATRAALAEGIVPGGSYSYIKFAASDKFVQLTKEVGKEIADMMRKTLLTPFKVLMQNASNDETKTLNILNKIMNSKKENYGYNIKTEEFEDLLASGVVDPYKVTRSALENAASVATLMLTSSAIITEHKVNNNVIDVSQNNIPNLF